jgi:DNA-binding MarR family transcriptional regulator
MLYKKYKLPIYQQIFYLGSRNSKFKTEMEHEFLTFRYNLVDFKTIPYREFLQSDKPEEIILAILGDFEKRKATEIAEQILRKINTLKIRNEIKLKSVKQLEVLSGLRNLQEIIDILIPKIMPLEYDITKDIRYKQGQEKGMEIGEAKEKKIRKKLDDVIIKFLKNGNMSIKEIAEFTNVSQAYVRKLAKSLEK